MSIWMLTSSVCIPMHQLRDAVQEYKRHLDNPHIEREMFSAHVPLPIFQVPSLLLALSWGQYTS